MRWNNMEFERSRMGWWVVVLVLAATAVFLTYSFVGLVVLGVFGYYAARPIYQRLSTAIDADGIVAGLALSVLIVPVIVLVLYTGLQLVQQLQQFLGTTGSTASLIQQYLGLGPLSNQQQQALRALLQQQSGQLIANPRQMLRTLFQMGLRVVGAVVGALLLLALAVTFSYFLLKHDDGLEDGLIELFGGRDTTAYAYATAVDEDLESVFFGNLVFVIAMSVIAASAYWATNMLAPQGLSVPMVPVLAFLTGIASLIPIVVGKVVYVPVVAYLAFQALRTSSVALAFVGGVLVAYFLALDILPQTFLQPYITGQQLDMILLMFGYLLGPLLFGWYGFFLLPIVFIVMLEAIRIILPELIHGDTLTPNVVLGENVGSNPRTNREEAAAEDDEAST
jgi:predicted PurR-regulated permease PerM